MKKIFLLSLIVALSACTKSNNSAAPKADSPEEVYNLDVNGIGFFSGSPLVENDPKIDLATVVQGQKKSLAITIKNMGQTATSLLSASLSDTKFYITSSTCSNKSLPPNGGSCSLTLNFSAVSKALQPFESTLQFGTSSIPVRIEVVSSSGQGGGGTASIKMYDGSTLISSPPDYSIGSVSGSSKISKVVTIKNEGTAATLIGDATLSSSDFYLSSNSCAGKALVVGQSCSVTVNFSATGKIAGSTKSTRLLFAGGEVSLSASVTSPPAPPAAQLAFMDGATTLSQDYHLGQYANNVTLSKTFTVRNTGGVASGSLSLQLNSNPSGYFTVSNSCSNISLAPGASCSFSLRVSTTGKAPGLHSVSLQMDQTVQVVDFERIASTFALDLRITGPGTVNFNSNSYSSDQIFTLAAGYGVTLLASPAANASVFYSGDCSGNSPAPLGCSLTLSSDKVTSVIFLCNSGFTRDGASCVANPPIVVTNIAISSDSKQITVTGTGLAAVVTAKLLKSSDQSELDSMEIFSQSATSLILKPSKDLVLEQGDIILRLL